MAKVKAEGKVKRKKQPLLSLRYFDLSGLAGFLLSCCFVFGMITSQQNQLAKNIFNEISIDTISSAPLVIFTDNLIGVKTPSSQTTFNSAWFARELSSTEHAVTLTFKHPLLVLLQSVIFQLFTVFYLIIFGILRVRFTRVLKAQENQFKQFKKQLKDNAYKAVHESLFDNKTSLSPESILPSALLSEQQLFEQKSHSRFDQELREQALLDKNTRIGSRDTFNNHLVAFLKEDECRGAVFLIQLKGCELAQNLYGDTQAMALLATAIEGIKSRIINIPDCFLSRQNEFELAILTPDLYVNDAEKLAERILSNLTSISLPVGINKEQFCHIGISYFKNDKQYYQIMSEADMALRSAQLQGPAQWFMYDPGEVAKETAIGSLKWRTFLEKVIQNKAFIIFSQPVLHYKDNHILHYEVLSKVSNNRGQLISPRIFLPMAEKCGLSGQIDLMVFEQVCQLIMLEQKDHAYSVNFSIEAIVSQRFQEQLYELLTQYPSVADKVIIEISEYHLKSRLNELIPILQTLKEKGFKILVDKVGQYVINAQYLEQCQISYLKLHNSIVIDIDKKPENQVFVQSLKVLCEPLNIPIYAVGVENIDEWRTLHKIGVTGGQGHYFNEPVAQMAIAMG